MIQMTLPNIVNQTYESDFSGYILRIVYCKHQHFLVVYILALCIYIVGQFTILRCAQKYVQQEITFFCIIHNSKMCVKICAPRKLLFRLVHILKLYIFSRNLQISIACRNKYVGLQQENNFFALYIFFLLNHMS